MRFLCDVHITYKLVHHLKNQGFEAVHINQILEQSETKDSDICRYADDNEFIVITKDADFRDFHFVKQTPRKLIKINLGNIANQELVTIISENIHLLKKFSDKPQFLLEVDKDGIKWIEV